MSTAARLSVAEYLEQEHPRNSELLDGVVVVDDLPLRHQRTCGELHFALEAWRRSPEGRGAVTLALGLTLGEDVLVPDLMWFAERLPRDAPRAPRTPHLVAEIRSPATWAHDVGRKRTVYEAHGVAELWLVDTSSATVLRFARSGSRAGTFDIEDELGGGQTLRSTLLPGFALQVTHLFDGPAAAAA